MSRRPRALITGFSGMVGSHLADYLLEHTDWDVHGLIRWNDDLANVDHLLPRINQKDRLGVVYGDLNDHPSLQKAIGAVQPDYVFHLAAQSYPKTSFDAPLETLQTNILGTAALLEAIRCGDRAPIVHVCASSEVFGRVPSHLLPIHEDRPFHPASPYAISKVGTDLVGRFYAEAYG
ncbi:MAG: GDP-mannose 4,6-dehydratase, partial [Planctomycetes bacterium]|nr:GDP-mannose 4,6-dehydratase [Planctomycetota bacterium]